MNKVILRTALITIAAIAVTALAVFSLWILCSPQTMATACEKTGNYSFAVTCADLRYKRTDNVYDLARCAEDGILSGKDGHVIKYCGALSSHAQFGELCDSKDKAFGNDELGKYRQSYKAYICGSLAAAQYRGGDFQSSLTSAKQGGPAAFTKLAIEIAERRDGIAAKSVIGALSEYEQTVQVRNLINLLKNYV